jgi:hypothetical protein
MIYFPAARMTSIDQWEKTELVARKAIPADVPEADARLNNAAAFARHPWQDIVRCQVHHR